MRALLILLMSVIVRGCDTNLDCNAGICWANIACYCCDTTRENDVCGGNMPGSWTGSTCENVKYYSGAVLSYHVLSDDVTCANDGSSPSVPDLSSQIESLAGAYTGVIKSMSCTSCTATEACTFYSGILVQFRTDFNTYYDSSCLDYPFFCDANWDYGATAYTKFKDVFIDGMPDFITNLETLFDSLGWSGTVTSVGAEVETETLGGMFYAAIMETGMCECK